MQSNCMMSTEDQFRFKDINTEIKGGENTSCQ